MMKTGLTLFLVAFLACINPMKAQISADSTKIKLNHLLDQWHKDAAQGNHDAYIGAMTPDGVFIGTDATEYWTTAEFSIWTKPYFDKKRTWSFQSFQRNLYIQDNEMTAWVDELLNTQMGVCRGSGTLIKMDGQWKIAQYVLSATIPNDIMKKVTALKSGTDSSIILKSIFDKYGVTGTMVILDPEKGSYSGYRPSCWDSGYLPASTFKIPNLLIALESGVIDTSYVFKWNGEKRRLPQWNKDLSLQEAFKVSCVPCFQELARKIGSDRMNTYLKKMNYPGMDVHQQNIDIFWLEGDSRITPRQQVEFMRKLNEEKLPLKKSVMQNVKTIMVQETTMEYTLSGKTGWAVRNRNNYGWFTGWLKSQDKTIYIATLIEPEKQTVPDDFTAARKLITMDVLRHFGLIK